MRIATIVGKVDDDRAAIERGPPCVSRWITLWSRVLRVYVATAQPSNHFQRIANMMVKFSVPMWFQIKRHSYMTDDPHNTFVCLQLLKHLNNTEKNIVKEVLQRNAFFAHPYQLLLAMCTVRDEAVNKIRKLKDQYIPNTNKDEAFSEAEAFLKLKKMMKGPTLMKIFLYQQIRKRRRIQRR